MLRCMRLGRWMGGKLFSTMSSDGSQPHEMSRCRQVTLSVKISIPFIYAIPGQVQKSMKRDGSTPAKRSRATRSSGSSLLLSSRPSSRQKPSAHLHTFMAPKPKSKAEEALQFLDDLDFSVDDVPPSPPPEQAVSAPSSAKASTTNPAPVTASTSRVSSEAGRKSADVSRKSMDVSGRKSVEASGGVEKATGAVDGAGKEAEDALKFLDGE
jgi:hypothetical protein